MRGQRNPRWVDWSLSNQLQNQSQGPGKEFITASNNELTQLNEHGECWWEATRANPQDCYCWMRHVLFHCSTTASRSLSPCRQLAYTTFPISCPAHCCSHCCCFSSCCSCPSGGPHGMCGLTWGGARMKFGWLQSPYVSS